MLEQKITFDKFIRWTAIALITVAVFAVTNYLDRKSTRLNSSHP